MEIWFLRVISLIVMIIGVHYWAKYRNCKTEKSYLEIRLKELKRRLDNEEKQNLKLYSTLTFCKTTIDHYKHVCKYGWLHLTTEINEEDDNDKGTIEVIGTSNLDPELIVVIKVFEFDKESNEDREFALREAKDLIDKIYE